MDTDSDIIQQQGVHLEASSEQNEREGCKVNLCERGVVVMKKKRNRRISTKTDGEKMSRRTSGGCEDGENRENVVHFSFDKSCCLWCLWCSGRHARWEKSQLKGRQWSMRGYLIRSLGAVGINRDLKARVEDNHKLRGWLSISSGERRRGEALSVGSEWIGL